MSALLKISQLLLLLSQLTDCQSFQVIDLTHSLNHETLRWPTNIKFKLTVVANESTPGGNWYASNDLAFSEHTGTHLDAPAHFSMRNGIQYSATIPPEKLVSPLVLIDLKSKATANRDYQATPSDIEEWESRYWKIPEGAMVLFDFGWEKYWPNFEEVFGSSSNDTTTFHFPAVGIEAAQLLADRKINGVGLDTPSLDYGPSQEFPVHKLLLEKNMYFLENVGFMSKLPEAGEGVTLVVGAMKIDGGTGGPARVLALVGDPQALGGAASLDNCASLTLAALLLIAGVHY